MPLPGTAISRMSWRRPPWPSASTFRCATSSSVRPALKPVARRGEVIRDRWSDNRGRLLQLKSRGVVARAVDDGRRRALHAEDSRHWRNARARGGLGRICIANSGRKRRARASTHLIAVGGSNARALADGAVQAGMPRGIRAPCREQRTKRLISPLRWPSRAISFSSRGHGAFGPKSWSIGSRRSSPDALQPPVSLARPGERPECRSVHHLPHGCREPDGAGHQSPPRAVADPQAPGISDRPDHPARRSGISCAEGRNPDDGWPSDPDGRDRPDASVGRSPKPVRLDCGACNDGVWRDWLHGRLSEDCPPLPSWADAPLQNARPDPRGDARRSSADCPRRPAAAPVHARG